MAGVYRLRQDHFINNVLLPAGQIVAEGVELPLNWKPTYAVDPRNSDAINSFWNQGPPGRVSSSQSFLATEYAHSGRLLQLRLQPPIGCHGASCASAGIVVYVGVGPSTSQNAGYHGMDRGDQAKPSSTMKRRSSGLRSVAGQRPPLQLFLPVHSAPLHSFSGVGAA
jgi:hypothetical protein